MAMLCLTCGRPNRGSRCPGCARTRHRAAYGGDYRARRAAAIRAEPWCHWPGGCAYPITRLNPLTANHRLAVARGGATGPLDPMCKRHNSGLQDRELPLAPGGGVGRGIDHLRETLPPCRGPYASHVAGSGLMPAASKPPGQRRRRNAATSNDVLPESCDLPVPRWPYPGATPKLWRDLWHRPIANVWHAQQIGPEVVARYVLTTTRYVEEPSAALGTVLGGLEASLRLTPLALSRLHLKVEPAPEPDDRADDPYAEMRARLEAVG